MKSALWERLQNPRPRPRRVWHDTNPSRLRGSERKSKFCSPSPILVMYPFQLYFSRPPSQLVVVGELQIYSLVLLNDRQMHTNWLNSAWLILKSSIDVSPEPNTVLTWFPLFLPPPNLPLHHQRANSELAARALWERLPYTFVTHL